VAVGTRWFSRSVPQLLVRRLMGTIPELLTTFGTSHAAVDVGRLLFRLFALALDLPETYFDDKV